MPVWINKIKATEADTQIAIDFIKSKLLRVKAECRGAVLASCSEILSNIATYAYDTKDGEIFFELSIDNKSVVITFKDKGRPFNPNLVEDEAISKGKGMGIFIARNMIDEYSYRYEDTTNISVIKKKR